MDKIDRMIRTLRIVSENPNAIDGIYDYCDRWCQRCPMTARCLLYAQEQADDAGRAPGPRDMEKEAYWKQARDEHAAAMSTVNRDGKYSHLATLTPEEEKEVEERERRRDKSVEDSGCTRLSMQYDQRVSNWFEANAQRFKDKRAELESAICRRIEGRDPHGEFDDLRDAVEVIRWDQFEIDVKLVRAVGGREDEDEEEFADYPELQSDGDGSAKVALLSIDRSLAAWVRMRRHFPEAEASILDLLVLLDRLRKKVELEFPKARAFQRVGFDYLPEPENDRKTTK